MGRNSGSRGSGFYKKHKLPAAYVVKEGEQMAVWDRRGRQNIFAGPCRKWVTRARVTFHDYVSADQNHYLKVTHTNGTVTHERGPISRFVDPVLHESITVQPAVRLEAMDAIVVNQSGTGDKKMGLSRRIMKGPTLYFPAPSETIRQFSWHGEDPSHKTRLIPGGRKFLKLNTMPEQLYYNVSDIRTADDALITVKFMLFYQLVDIERMLSATEDPIADCMNALKSDLVAFGSFNTFEEVLSKTAELGNLLTFTSLTTVAPTLGLRVEKVVYRGYQASYTLQLMHNKAITERNNLKLRAEKIQQDIEVESQELDKELEMVVKSNEITLSSKKSDVAMQDELFAATMEQMTREDEASLQREQADTDVEIAYLTELKNKGVQLTPYLLSTLDRVDKVIHVHGDDDGDGGARGGSRVNLQFST